MATLLIVFKRSTSTACYISGALSRIRGGFVGTGSDTILSLPQNCKNSPPPESEISAQCERMWIFSVPEEIDRAPRNN